MLKNSPILSKTAFRARLWKPCDCFVEARHLSAQRQIGMIQQHREKGTLMDIGASVRGFMLPAGQLKEVKKSGVATSTASGDLDTLICLQARAAFELLNRPKPNLLTRQPRVS